MVLLVCCLVCVGCRLAVFLVLLFGYLVGGCVNSVALSVCFICVLFVLFGVYRRVWVALWLLFRSGFCLFAVLIVGVALLGLIGVWS